MGKNRVTMSDIAKQAGTSVTSVSFVLNDLARVKGVSRQLERRIRRVAADLDYQPSLLAKSLAGGRTSVIGAVFRSLSDATASRYLRSIQNQAHQSGYQVMVAQHEADNERLADIVRGFLGRHVDGLILAPTIDLTDQRVYRELRDRHVPLVFIDCDLGVPDVSLVSFDGQRAVEMSVEHLAGLGHRRIALFNAAPELALSRQRTMAYRMSLERLGLAFDPALHRHGRLWDDQEQRDRRVHAEVEALRTLPEPATALVTVSSDHAIAAYQAITAGGRRIPEDISLVAVTGRHFTGFDRARITSALFSYEDMGRMAFKVLWDEISQKKLTARIYLPPVFVEGDTVGPPK